MSQSLRRSLWWSSRGWLVCMNLGFGLRLATILVGWGFGVVIWWLTVSRQSQYGYPRDVYGWAQWRSMALTAASLAAGWLLTERDRGRPESRLEAAGRWGVRAAFVALGVGCAGTLVSYLNYGHALDVLPWNASQAHRRWIMLVWSNLIAQGLGGAATIGLWLLLAWRARQMGWPSLFKAALGLTTAVAVKSGCSVVVLAALLRSSEGFGEDFLLAGFNACSGLAAVVTLYEAVLVVLFLRAFYLATKARRVMRARTGWWAAPA